MKTGRPLDEMFREVLRQSETKRDFIADTRNLEMTQETKLKFGDLTVGINEVAHDQIGSHVKIPSQYYDKMRKEAPELLSSNVNTWFKKYPAVRMIRTLDEKARAFPSDKFRTLDNFDLLQAAWPPLREMGVEVLSCDVTETKMYLKVVDRRILRDLPVGWSGTNRGHQQFDTLSPALTLSNSEVGCGSLAVQASVFTGGCSNLMVIREKAVRKYHVGQRHELGEDIYRMLSDQTKRLTDAALWATIRDVVRGAFDQAQFDATCKRLKDSTEEKISGDPIKVVEVTAKKYGMTDDERNAVLRHLVEGGSLTKYGLHSAVTRAAEDLASYDRASQFEQIGGNIVELNKNEWNELAVAA